MRGKPRWRETPTELRHSGVIGHRDMADYSDEELMAIIRTELDLAQILPMKTVSDTEAQVSTVKEPRHPVVRLVPSGR